MIKLRPINKQYIIRNVCFSVGLIILAFSRTREGISPFNLGFLSALFYSGGNMFLLAPVYFLSGALADPTVKGLIVSVAPPLVFISTYLLHRLTKRPVKALHALFYTALSLIPQLAYGLDGTSNILPAAANVLLTLAFAYISGVTCRAALVENKRYRFASDELVGVFAIIAGLSMGIFSFNIYGFKPFYLITPFLIMFTLNIGGKEAIYLSLAFGLGAGALNGNISVMAGLVLSSVTASIFIRNNSVLSAAAYLLGDLLSGMFFNAYGDYGYLHLAATVVSLSAYLLIPSRIREKIIAAISSGESNSVRAVLKRVRDDEANKLKSVSAVFEEISEGLYGAKYIDVENDRVDRQIAEEVALEVCSRCKEYSSCYGAMGGDVAASYEKLATIARAREVTARDISPYLSSRCVNTLSLLSAINAKASGYNEYLEKSGQISISRIIVAEQMRGIAEIMNGLSGELAQRISFDGEREKRIADELRYANIAAREILCLSSGGWRIVAIVKRKDSGKRELIECVERVLKCPLEITRVSDTDNENFVSVELRDRAKFSVDVGVSSVTKDGSAASGDTYSCGSIGGGKYIIALSDGMGSGSVAHYNSCSTISMIENYYKAGFNNNIILTLINRILAEFNKESFTCLDMAVADLNSGIVDFIKLGGVESVILTNGDADIVSSGALPMGIVEEAEPVTVRKALTDGDIAVLMSDGVSDALGIDGVSAIVSAKKELKAEDLAALILRSATEDGAKDDATVICMKLVSNN